MPWVSLIARRQSGRARPPVSNGWSRADAAEFRHHARQPGAATIVVAAATTIVVLGFEGKFRLLGG
jgi:uncharacterized heparinase superfamily protein